MLHWDSAAAGLDFASLPCTRPLVVCEHDVPSSYFTTILESDTWIADLYHALVGWGQESEARLVHIFQSGCVPEQVLVKSWQSSKIL